MLGGQNSLRHPKLSMGIFSERQVDRWTGIVYAECTDR